MHFAGDWLDMTKAELVGGGYLGRAAMRMAVMRTMALMMGVWELEERGAIMLGRRVWDEFGLKFLDPSFNFPLEVGIFFLYLL